MRDLKEADRVVLSEDHKPQKHPPLYDSTIGERQAQEAVRQASGECDIHPAPAGILFDTVPIRAVDADSRLTESNTATQACQVSIVMRK